MYQPREAEMPRQQRVDPKIKRSIWPVVILAIFVAGGFFLYSHIQTSGASPAISLGESPSTPQSEWQKGVTPALYQFDPQWADYSYAGSNFSESGCGPTCLSMAYISLTGKTDVTPIDAAQIATEGGFAGAEGTDWLYMIAGAEELGLRAHQFVLSEARMQEYLAQGYPIICIMGAGDFTTTGHFIVIAGVADDGTFIVRDPNSQERTQQTWSFDQLYSQHLSAWVYWLE